MTEQDLINRQEELGEEQFLVTKSGTFYAAYACGAFALSRPTGYRVMRRQRKGGRHVLTTGFPESRLEWVKEQIVHAGGVIEREDENSFVFSGIAGTATDIPVSDEQVKGKGTKKAHEDNLTDMIMSFDLSHSTPMEAMMFIDKLQKALVKP